MFHLDKSLEELDKKGINLKAKGGKYIFPIYEEKWDKFVDYANCKPAYDGCTEKVIDLMEAYDSSLITRDVVRIFNEQDNTKEEKFIISSIMLEFCKEGPEFWLSTTNGEISNEEWEYYSKKRNENKVLKEIYSSLENCDVNIIKKHK